MAIREYIVKIHWRRLGTRMNLKRYSIIARDEQDALAFAEFRFWRSHPGGATTIVEIEAIVVDRWGQEMGTAAGG